MIFHTSLARENWATKYQYNQETPLATFQRVARALAEVEKGYGASDKQVEEYYDLFLKTIVRFEEAPLDYTGDDAYKSLDGKMYRAMGLKCTPGGRITANAGTSFSSATLMNCFVTGGVKGASISYKRQSPDGLYEIPVRMEGSKETSDDLLNIMVSLTEQSMTLSNEGGYGVNFDFIRPRGSLIKGTGVRHPGVIAYMEVWDKVADMIVRGDKDGYTDTLMDHLPQNDVLARELEKAMPRKGAQMGCLSIWHPDIEEFVRAKQTPGRLTKFNLSVLVDDLFMEAVAADDFYDLHFEGVVYKRIKARELYELIMESTYNRAEPGVLFHGNMNRVNPILYLGENVATNPCGEVGGNPYTSTVCLLGSLNLTQYVRKDRTFDWELYQEDIFVFARMLENVNDIAKVPLPHYQWAVENVRQYGMGINGLGSAHYMLGLKYGSAVSIEFTEKVNRIKENSTWKSSALLAKERGPAPAFDADQFFETPFFLNTSSLTDEVKDLMRKHGLRNLKTTTNPPLGNSSVICDMVSNGIEPVFSHEYYRKAIVDQWPEGMTLENVKTLLQEVQIGDEVAWSGEYAGRKYYYEPHNRGLCFEEPVRDYGYAWLLKYYPEEMGADYLVTTQDLDVMVHVDVQTVVQKHVNQSVSKTSNLPSDYPFEDFKNLYMQAWEKGLNGFTTYRAGTMGSVISTESDEGETSFSPVVGDLLPSLMEAGCTPEGAEVTADGVVIREVRLPKVYHNGPTTQIKREGCKFYLHLSYLPQDVHNPIAFWIHSNDRTQGEYVTLNRAVRSIEKLLLDAGVDKDLVLDQKEKIHDDPRHVKLGKNISMALRHNITLPRIVEALTNIEGDYIATTLTAVRKYLSEHIPDGTKKLGVACEQCGSEDVVFESGCSVCRECGHTQCGG